MLLNGAYSNTIVTSGIKVLSISELKNAASLLGKAFKEDTENINNGYPILSWE